MIKTSRTELLSFVREIELARYGPKHQLDPTTLVGHLDTLRGDLPAAGEQAKEASEETKVVLGELNVFARQLNAVTEQIHKHFKFIRIILHGDQLRKEAIQQRQAGVSGFGKSKLAAVQKAIEEEREKLLTEHNAEIKDLQDIITQLETINAELNNLRTRQPVPSISGTTSQHLKRVLLHTQWLKAYFIRVFTVFVELSVYYEIFDVDVDKLIRKLEIWDSLNDYTKNNWNLCKREYNK